MSRDADSGRPRPAGQSLQVPSLDAGTSESEALARYRGASRRRRREGGAAPAGPERGLKRQVNRPGFTKRDPQQVGDVWRVLAEDTGWSLQLAVWSLANRWAEIVGEQVAAHVTVKGFEAAAAAAVRTAEPQQQQDLLLGADREANTAAESGGVLTLVADDNAWQQQMIWGLSHLQRRLDAELGPGVVSRIVVLGPAPRRGGRRGKH